MVGGVFSQTTLELTGGTNRDLPSGDHLTSGIIQFRDNGIRSCLGGSAWAASYNSGETHTFTVTLEDSDNESCTLYLGAYSEDISSNWYGSYTPIAEQSISVPDTKTLTLTVSSSYHGVYLYANGYKKVNIRSITRTITTASSVDKPTITAPATYDGESTAVTITPGANNHHVKYSVSGSNNDVSNVSISAETTIYIAGSSDVTITAIGYKDENETEHSDTETVTVVYGIPSGITQVWSGSQDFGNEWHENVQIDKSKFADLEIGDYIFLYATHSSAVPNIGFRNDWDDSTLKTYEETSGGNAAYGNMTAEETYWWLKITDATLRDIFKNGHPRIQGQSFTLTSVEIHKAITVSESDVTNSITKGTGMILNLTRTFAANTWNTICLPFKPTADQATEMFGSGYKVAAFTGVSNETMEFTSLTSINDFVAGTPYLVWATQSEKSSFTFFNVNITARQPQPVEWGDYQFVGLFEKKSFQESEWPTTRFVAAGNKLKTPNSTSALKALRAYFVVPASIDPNHAPKLSIDGEGEATEIISLDNERVIMDNVYYDLSGRRVMNPTKGLYIVNGRKVIIK